MKSSNTFAAIDIGSFNCRLIVVERLKEKFKILHNYSRETNLIKHIAFNNEFSPKKISQTINCLIIISKKLKNLKIKNYRCVATEACRQVINPNFFVNEVKSKTGLNVEIISSYEEGRLSYEGCKTYCNNTKRNGLIFDIGGGSTELTFFNQPKVNFFTKSSSYGVINLSEKNQIFGKEYVKKQIQKYINDIKQKLELKKKNLLAIGSCSTMTSLCAIFLRLKFYDPRRIEGQILSINDINQTCELVLNLTTKEKLKHPCIGKRHELLDNGIYILKSLIEEIPIKEIIVTNKGLRHGMINDFFWFMKIKLKKKKNDSSNKWLTRHLNDEFYKKSKKDGFRSRASYKLIEINQKFQIFKNCKFILDLGCSPGGWTQVARRNSPKECKILGIDKLDLKEIVGVKFIQDDIFNEDIFNVINTFFNSNKVDLILNDMSPNSTGNKNIDHLRIVSLVERVLFIANNLLKKEGTIISKIFQGGAQGDLLEFMKINFYSIKYYKPKASRKESSETYLIGKKK